MKDWGPSVFQDKTAEFLKISAINTGKWLKYQKVDGLKGLAAIHEDVCHGKIAADVGLIIKM